MNKKLKYMLAGAIATIPMTMAMVVMHKHLPSKEKFPLPPRRVALNASQSVGLKKYLDQDEKFLITMVGHFSFGAMVAIGYFPFVKKTRIPDRLAGPIYGLLIWGGSYLGMLPALRLHRNAVNEPRHRNELMISAHIIWGAALGFMNKFFKL